MYQWWTWDRWYLNTDLDCIIPLLLSQQLHIRAVSQVCVPWREYPVQDQGAAMYRRLAVQSLASEHLCMACCTMLVSIPEKQLVCVQSKHNIGVYTCTYMCKNLTLSLSFLPSFFFPSISSTLPLSLPPFLSMYLHPLLFLCLPLYLQTLGTSCDVHLLMQWRGNRCLYLSVSGGGYMTLMTLRGWILR